VDLLHLQIHKQMNKQARLDKVFINIAKEVSQLSHCVRSKVGAVLVKDGNLISFGYNGTPAGMDNCCEDKIYIASDVGGWIDIDTIDETYPHTDDIGRYKLGTKQHTIHAEVNAILKAAKSGNSVDGSTLYLTLSPCIECSKLILQSGVKKVVYLENYRDTKGIEFLKQFIEIEKYE